MSVFGRHNFPSVASLIQAKRAPVLFRPIVGSEEQMIVGTIVLSEGSAYLARANRLDRLECLYGAQSVGPIMAIKLSLDELEEDLAVDPASIFSDYTPLMSGLSIGAVQIAEGHTLETIATTWLGAMSSLFDEEGGAGAVYTAFEDADAPRGERATERLGELLLHYVEERRPALAGAFSNEIRSQVRRRRGNAHGVFLDFAGSRIVANFGLLTPTGYAGAIDRIKRRMWDLKVSRDNERDSFVRRDHEMIVQHPSANDPTLSQKQLDRIFESVEDLEKQADQEDIRFRPLTSVEQIGDHLLYREAA